MAGPASTDFLDYIFQFSSQGDFLRDTLIQQFAPSAGGVKIVAQMLIYNPVETLSSPAKVGNPLVVLPQQACSTVALSGFWGMITLQGNPGPLALMSHPNLQILNDRTLMFANQSSVLLTKIDVSHINILFNSFGVYTRDGLGVVPLPPPQSEPVPVIFG